MTAGSSSPPTASERDACAPGSVGRSGRVEIDRSSADRPTDRPDAKLNVYVPVGMGCSPVPSTAAGAADADGDEFQYCAAHAVAGLLADGRLCAAVRSASDSFGRIGFDVLATVIRRQSRYDLARVAGLSGSHADRWTSLVGRSTGQFMAEVVFFPPGQARVPATPSGWTVTAASNGGGGVPLRAADGIRPLPVESFGFLRILKARELRSRPSLTGVKRQRRGCR